MRYTSIAVSAITALTLFSPAVTGAAIRRNVPAAGDASSAKGGSYTITYSTDKGEEVAHADEKGAILAIIKGVLIRVAIDDKNDIAQCIVKDKDGNQIRKFGGPDIEQTYIDFEDEDGKQAKTIVCAIGEQKGGDSKWEDSKPSPKPTESKWADHPVPTPSSTSSVPPPKETKWVEEPKHEQWSDVKPPVTSTTSRPPPPPPAQPTKWVEEPKHEQWSDVKPPVTSTTPPPAHPTKWVAVPAPKPPVEPKKEDWTASPKPVEPKPVEPKKEDWTASPKPVEHKPAPQAPAPPSPPKEEPKQEGWGDNKGHDGGKPQEGNNYQGGKPEEGHGGPQQGGPQGGPGGH